MRYQPNNIPLKDRMVSKLFSVVLIVYGGYGIYVNDLCIPSRRGGFHLSDEPALLMYAAFICGSLVMLSVVIDHYDERDNEHKYQLFSKFFKLLGLALVVASVVWRVIG